MNGISVGVDLGGTWIRVVALDRRIRTFRSVRSPAPPLDQLPRYLKALFKKWRLSKPDLAVASRGVWTRSERADLMRSCRKLAGGLKVMSDVEAAWLAAFSPLYSCGILVIAGTGSIAYARDPTGRVSRAGGLGPLLGDEGSGFWIGREWLRSGKVSIPRRASVSAVAGFAPGVLRRAARGHATARRIVRDAQASLTGLVDELAGAWPTNTAVPVSCAGSVLQAATFRRGFQRSAQKKSRRPLLFVEPLQDAAHALAASFHPLDKDR